METLILKEEDLNKHTEIGSGDEGYVYSYRDEYAVKIFHKWQWNSPSDGRTIEILMRKMKKVEAMMALHDKAAAFPLGFAEVPKEDDIAYYMKKAKSPYFHPFPYTRNISNLWYEDYEDGVEEIMLQADAALQRLHKLGIAIGDVKETNILLDNDKDPFFVDLDNALFQDFPFDTYPVRADFSAKMFGADPTAYQDNDKALFAKMALYMKTKDDAFFNPEDKEEIAQGIRRLHTDKETKAFLRCIFSDALNKPYIGEVLQRIRRY